MNFWMMSGEIQVAPQPHVDFGGIKVLGLGGGQGPPR